MASKAGEKETQFVVAQSTSFSSAGISSSGSIPAAGSSGRAVGKGSSPAGDGNSGKIVKQSGLADIPRTANNGQGNKSESSTAAWTFGYFL